MLEGYAEKRRHDEPIESLKCGDLHSSKSVKSDKLLTAEVRRAGLVDHQESIPRYGQCEEAYARCRVSGGEDVDSIPDYDGM